MKWDKDTIILAINIMITIVSSFGAYKSFRYFKKSKHITIYANTSQALNELGEMLKMLPEALAATSNTKRGFNSENAIKDIGTKLFNHLNEIMNAMPTEYMTEFQDLQKTEVRLLRKTEERCLERIRLMRARNV